MRIEIAAKLKAADKEAMTKAVVIASRAFFASHDHKVLDKHAQNAARRFGIKPESFKKAVSKYITQTSSKLTMLRAKPGKAARPAAKASIPETEINKRVTNFNLMFDQPHHDVEAAERWSTVLYGMIDELDADRSINTEAMRLIASGFSHGHPLAKGKSRKWYKRQMESRVHMQMTFIYKSASRAGRSAA